MGRVLFKITDLGDDLTDVRRVYDPHWDVLRLCEDACLYRREAHVVFLWALGCTRTQISKATGVARPNIGPTLRRGVLRIAKREQGKRKPDISGVRGLLTAFRNRRSWPDHGPALMGTRNRGYREVSSPRLVDAMDLRPQPIPEFVLRRLAMDVD